MWQSILQFFGLSNFQAGQVLSLPNSPSLSIVNFMSEKSTKTNNSIHDEFQKELNNRGIINFSSEECLYLGASNSRHKNNHIPSKDLWPNFWPTIEIADEVRGRIAKPLKISSAYRSPSYNRSVGGARYSQHVEFRAIDISAPKTTLKKLYAELLQMRKEGHKIAIGRYPTFIHIDTRGTNTSWGSATY